MRILAIDTSTKFFCLALYDRNRACTYRLEAGRGLSKIIALTIKRILDARDLEAKDIDYFACAQGPGSFTGLRIGMATLKAMAWSADKPAVGIPSLDILAENAQADKFTTVVPVIDAKRGLIYASAYKNKKRILPYLLCSIKELSRKIKGAPLFLGDALGIYKDEILDNFKNAGLLDADHWFPEPENVLALAARKIKANKITDAFRIKPLYIYPKECQIKKA